MNLAGSAKNVPRQTSRLRQLSSSLSQATCTLVSRVVKPDGDEPRVWHWTSLYSPHHVRTSFSHHIRRSKKASTFTRPTMCSCMALESIIYIMCACNHSIVEYPELRRGCSMITSHFLVWYHGHSLGVSCLHGLQPQLYG